MASSGTFAAVALAVIFGSGGIALLANTPAIREIAGCRRGSCVPLGILGLAAAGFLLLPEARIWGVAVAASMLLGAAFTLFYRRRYLWCVPPIMLLAALVPVAFAR
ncbi:MAG: hypothetical protein KGJ79_12820 [Alphaproteobacteria bacterium]|nr:hypothetical protein [Alphaproteobacteria bacterium]MDE2112019.1 hypothetical protein [Alphaproteobacteria bacterium]MDE2494627.1 hypothetical protein [Alphaproteobacteria bacterium]